MTFPALNALLGKWVPVHERGKIGTLAFAGTQIGNSRKPVVVVFKELIILRPF